MPAPSPSPLFPSARVGAGVAPAVLAAATCAVLTTASGGALAVTCEARSGPVAPMVVELYTSEGCSSCPPADRWLSGLKRRDDVLALSFHVNYWDRLGWADRFASPAYTERQRALMAPSGARYVYTPQVIVDGADWRSWPSLPATRRPAPLDLQLQRDGAAWTAVLQPRAGQPLPSHLSAYWVQLEDGHRSDVRAGENAGEKLAHDHVVRQYQPVDAWPSQRGQRLQWTPAPSEARDAGLPRRTALVVVDPATQRPLQALVAGC